MIQQKKRLVVVCPGRGSYTKDNLKSLMGRKAVSQAVVEMDQWRTELNLPTLSSLDQAESFKVSLHTLGEHASPLIFACALADFLEINRERYEVVAVTGNSMGWYLALAMTEVLSLRDSFSLIQTMGSMMKTGLIGGQIIYPVIHEDWTLSLEIQNQIQRIMAEHNQHHEPIYISIVLGGYWVLAGEQNSLQEFSKKLPKIENYPFQLVNHAAFHTPLLNDVSQRALIQLKNLDWSKPQIPLIDGRGVIWQPHSSDMENLYDYTLGHQVTETYHFSNALTVALKEFCPDHIVLLGPGNSLGGSIGQILIANQWQGIHNKSDFVERQKTSPYLLSMGMAEQKKILT